MKNTSNTLNEEIKRIKSLFTEERLYGNLVEQEEETFEMYNVKNKKSKKYTKEEIIDKIKKGRMTDENAQIFIDEKRTKLSDSGYEWLTNALKDKETKDFEDEFGKRRLKKDKTKNKGEEEVVDSEEEGPSKKEKKEQKKKRSNCINGVSKYLNAYNKSSKGGEEEEKKFIEGIIKDDMLKKYLEGCAVKFKDDKEFQEMEYIGNFMAKLGVKDTFPISQEKETEGGGSAKGGVFDITNEDGDKLAVLKYTGSDNWELKSKSQNKIVNDSKDLNNWVKDAKGWPEGKTPAEFESLIKPEGISTDRKTITFTIPK